MRKHCKNKHCPNLAVVGGAYCLSCRRRRRQQLRASHGICRDWSIYAVPIDQITNAVTTHPSPAEPTVEPIAVAVEIATIEM